MPIGYIGSSRVSVRMAANNRLPRDFKCKLQGQHKLESKPPELPAIV